MIGAVIHPITIKMDNNEKIYPDRMINPFFFSPQ